MITWEFHLGPLHLVFRIEDPQTDEPPDREYVPAALAERADPVPDITPQPYGDRHVGFTRAP